MKYKLNEIVKFIDNAEPCIIYHVIDPIEQMLWSDQLHCIVPQIKLEVIGMVPVQVLEKPRGVVGNAFAIDIKLYMLNQTN